MAGRINVKITTGETTLPNLYFRIGVVAAKTTLNEHLVPGLTTSGPEWTIIDKSLHDSILLGMAGDHDQVKLSHVIVAQINAAFKQNSRDIEKQSNILGDITLPGKLGHEVLADKKAIVIPDIFLKLTSNKGELAYRFKAHDLAYSYNLECTQLDEDRSVILLTDKPLQNAIGLVQGFVPSALYICRAQPVFARGVKGEFTAYFEIRMG